MTVGSGGCSTGTKDSPLKDLESVDIGTLSDSTNNLKLYNSINAMLPRGSLIEAYSGYTTSNHTPMVKYLYDSNNQKIGILSLVHETNTSISNVITGTICHYTIGVGYEGTIELLEGLKVGDKIKIGTCPLYYHSVNLTAINELKGVVDCEITSIDTVIHFIVKNSTGKFSSLGVVNTEGTKIATQIDYCIPY